MPKYKVQVIINTKKILTKTVDADSDIKATAKVLLQSKQEDWKIDTELKTTTR